MTQIVGPGRGGRHPRKSAFLSQIQCSLYCVGGRFPLRDICVFVVCASVSVHGSGKLLLGFEINLLSGAFCRLTTFRNQTSI